MRTAACEAGGTVWSHAPQKLTRTESTVVATIPGCRSFALSTSESGAAVAFGSTVRFTPPGQTTARTYVGAPGKGLFEGMYGVVSRGTLGPSEVPS